MTQSATTTGGRDVMDVRPGLPAPMGSTPDVGGTNFAVYSASGLRPPGIVMAPKLIEASHTPLAGDQLTPTWSPSPRSEKLFERPTDITPADADKPTETEVARENLIDRQQLH
jgi:hypothetical protein